MGTPRKLLLPVDQRDDVGAPLLPKPLQLKPPVTEERRLLELGVDEGEDDEEDPDVVEYRIQAEHNNHLKEVMNV